MKKLFLISIIGFLYGTFAFSQEKIVVHQGDSELFKTEISNINNVNFLNNNSFFNLTNGNIETIPLSSIDSITFVNEPIAGEIFITYNDNEIAIINPYASSGVAITHVDAMISVTATAGIENLVYNILGHSANGSLTIASDKNIILTLDNLTLTNTAGAAIEITSTCDADIKLVGTNTLSDGAGSSKDAPLVSKGGFVFEGTGSLQVSGVKKHGISSKKTIEVLSGNFTVTSSSDGFHSEGFTMRNGLLNIVAMGDGIDAGGLTVQIDGGQIEINSTAADVKGIKSDDVMTINGGTITMTIAGAQSKGLSCKKNLVINGGNIGITAAGDVVLTAAGSGYDPSYCTAIKADSLIQINNGTINITSTASAKGGKGLSCDKNIVINGGNLTVTTAGNGAVYTTELGKTDSYTAACIKADGNLQILGGTVNCNSSGTGGKGINVEGTITIGVTGANDSDLTLKVGTSGARFLVSGSTGGGKPGGSSSTDYANPKAIKSTGNLTINSGTIRINCPQTTEGGEGLESKAVLTINGGDIEVRAYDDPINGGTAVIINNGKVYAVARGNDAIDSNGTLAINGGIVIANGVKGDGEGIDSDRNYTVGGGILFATSGSTMCSPAGPQKAVVYSSAKAGQSICVKNSAGTTILMYTVPVITGASSGTTLKLVFTHPQFVQGTYTLLYGGTISGGTNYNGYVTGGTYSGGSTKNFTIGTAALVTVN